MIFLPNKSERYAAALRLAVKKMIEKNGYSKKNYEILKKIHRSEALFLSEPTPCDIESLLKCLLLNVFFNKGGDFKFGVYVNHNYIINKKLLISLILSLCEKSQKITVSEFKNKLLITANCDITNNIKPLIKKLCGIYFYEIKTNRLNILISAKTTKKTDIFIKKDLELLQGPMSCINFYIH